MAQLKDTIVLGDLRVTDALSADEITANKVTSNELELDLLNATLIKVALSSSGSDHTKGITFGNNVSHIVANGSGALILQGNGLYLRGQNNEVTGVAINLNSAMFPETSTATTSSLDLGTDSKRWNTVYSLDGNFNGTIAVKDTIYVNAQGSGSSGGISFYSSEMASLLEPTSYGIAMRTGAVHGWIMAQQTNADIARALNISTDDKKGTDWNINFYNDGSKLRGFKFMRGSTAIASINGYGYLQANRLGIYHDGTHSSRLYWYRPTYYTWVDYMTNGADGDAPTGGKPSTLGNVSTWSMHHLLENTNGYGWIWESCSNAVQSNTTTKPTARMALSSHDGRLYLNTSGDATTRSITITDTAGIASGSYKTFLDHKVSNLASGGNTMLLTGHSNANNKQASFGFHYDTTATNGTNAVGSYAFVGVYGNETWLKVYQGGRTVVDTLTINNSSTEKHLEFSSSGSWNYIIFPSAANTYLSIGTDTGNDNAKLVLTSAGLVRPGGNATQSFGDNDHRWKYTYVSHNIYVGATGYTARAAAARGVCIQPGAISIDLESVTTLPGARGLDLYYNTTRQAHLSVETIGTTEQAGQTMLILGNGSTDTIANNSYGTLRLYGVKSGYTNIRSNPDGADGSGTRTYYLPNYAGTMYGTCRSSNAAIGGSQSQPVYVEASGRILGMSYVSVAYGGTGATTARNARKNLGLGNSRVYYGECTDGAGTNPKKVICDELEDAVTSSNIPTGTILIVKNNTKNTVAVDSLQLEVRKTSTSGTVLLAAKSVQKAYTTAVGNLTNAGEWLAGILTLVYTGSVWQLTSGDYNTNTNNATAQNYSTTNSTYPMLMSATADITNTTNRGNVATILNNQIYGNPLMGRIFTTGLTLNYHNTYQKLTFVHNPDLAAGSVDAVIELVSQSLCLGHGTSGVYVNLSTNRLMGAAWNDYAEYRASQTNIPGTCVCETDTGLLVKTTNRLMPGASIISDTYGFAQGQTEAAETPVAVSGRVLAIPYRDRSEYHAGMAVCSAPNGTIDIMTREEIMMYPDCIVGIVSEIPQYTEWGDPAIQVNNRIWIKVR